MSDRHCYSLPLFPNSDLPQFLNRPNLQELNTQTQESQHPHYIPASSKPHDLTDFAFSFGTVVVIGKELMELMIVNLLFAFVHNAFNDSLVGGEVFETVDGDSPVEIVELVG